LVTDAPSCPTTRNFGAGFFSSLLSKLSIHQTLSEKSSSDYYTLRNPARRIQYLSHRLNHQVLPCDSQPFYLAIHPELTQIYSFPAALSTFIRPRSEAWLQSALEGRPLVRSSCTYPFTCNALFGSFLAIPTPPLARMRNWFSPVEVKSSLVESAQTKVPLWLALARRPAAKL